jgi:hypothetical protein
MTLSGTEILLTQTRNTLSPHTYTPVARRNGSGAQHAPRIARKSTQYFSDSSFCLLRVLGSSSRDTKWSALRGEIGFPLCVILAMETEYEPFGTSELKTPLCGLLFRGVAATRDGVTGPGLIRTFIDQPHNRSPTPPSLVGVDQEGDIRPVQSVSSSLGPLGWLAAEHFDGKKG